ncbi:zinc finger and BTB domain-containing protein 34 [Callorhinchus milii]|uniref:Zinc finger and BTB domain containing 34 n=1 Tax=Callorhinchus milii TaxID=7868 RepID=A0A4W3J0Z9_CALMI|nr:zinc finger and BTB domain-containing protein 34 [Callorhinchus milii]XP_007909613.1 zinc finger and BTB domain-containing protein 34 [Callorhinchus milii]|eukprot:gi/632985316/ref/XP_007909612.1/ PREDICTED: zinc finger and BTB domain-containing protein 34 [Callorhinchus milii]
MDSSGYIQFEVAEYSNCVLSQLNELRLQGKLCDIIVHIQGQPFRAHKAVLAASSPYFRDHSALSTMSGLSISVIKNPDVFEQLLAFCYTGRLSLHLKDVVSFLTAASFLQMQCIIDKCTQILESIHSKFSIVSIDSVVVGGGGADESPPSGTRNGVREGAGRFLNPVDISPPYYSQARQPVAGEPRSVETPSGRTFPSRSLGEERHSDPGSGGSVSEHEIPIEGDQEQGELMAGNAHPMAGQITEVKVKMEKAERPSCSDSSSVGDDGYHTEMVDADHMVDRVVAVNVGTYGPVLQQAFSLSQSTSQATGYLSPSTVTGSSPSRSMLSGFRGRGRLKRQMQSERGGGGSAVGLGQGGGQCQGQAGDGEGGLSRQSYEGSGREHDAREHWFPYNQRLICIYCGKSFNQKGSLDRHMRLHMGITPFVCRFCGKKYTRKDQLEYHIRGHTDDKPYRCELCGKCFPFQGTLNQHLRKNHPGVTELKGRPESPDRIETQMEQKEVSNEEPSPSEEPAIAEAPIPESLPLSHLSE